MAKYNLLELSLYELTSQDFNVWVGAGNQERFELHLENEDGDVYQDDLTPLAAEAMAEFCKRYLWLYTQANKQMAELELDEHCY